jgi:beta-mannosidase
MAVHIDKSLAEQFPPAKDFAEWHCNAQELQARSLRSAIDWLASNRQGGRCMGALIWQFNDAWPGMSWSLVDSDGVPKPAYEAVREAFGAITP